MWRRVLVLLAPQVRIAPVPETQQLQEALAGLPVLLECQVSPPDTPVHWLKDGKAVLPTDVLTVHSEGCLQRLHISAAVPSDSGMYTCNAGDDAASFRVTVRGELPGECLFSCGAYPALWLSPSMCLPAEAPVGIVSSNKDAPHAYMAGQRVELWCQLSRPAAPVHWYKDGEEVEAGENLLLEQEGPLCQLVLPCARPQDTGDFICDARDVSVSYHVSVAGWWHSRDVLGRAALPWLCAVGSQPCSLPSASQRTVCGCLTQGLVGAPFSCEGLALWAHCVLKQLLPLCRGVGGCSTPSALQRHK